MHRTFAFLFLLLAGCSTTGDSKPQGPLASQIGQQVELQGSYGIGKLANYIKTSSAQIYLFDPPLYTLKYGANIIAKGKLEYFPGAPGSSCDAYGCAVPGIPPHYFIRGAAVVVAP